MKHRRGRRETIGSCLVTAVDTVGTAVLIPALPSIQSHFHITAFLASALISVFPVTQAIAGGLLGWLSDRRSRKRIILGCLALGFLSYLLLARAETYAMLLLARALSGIASGSISVTQAYLIEDVEADERPRIFGVLGMASSLGFLGGLIIISLLGVAATGEARYSSASILCCFLFLACLLFNIFALRGDALGRRPASSAGFSVAQLPKHSLYGLVLYFLITTMFSELIIVLPFHMVSAGQPDIRETGLLYVMMSLLVDFCPGRPSAAPIRFVRPMDGNRQQLLAGCAGGLRTLT